MGSFTSKENLDEEIIIRCSLHEMVKCFVKEYLIVWHDPNLNSKENANNGKQLQIICALKTFTDFKEASQFIEGTQQNCFVITSGTNGEAFVKEIFQKANVPFIYIFCKNIHHHSQWAKKYTKISCVENRFLSVISKLNKNMMEWQRNSSSLRVDFPAFAPVFDDGDKTEMNYLHLYLKGLIKFNNRELAQNDFIGLAKAIYPDKQNIDNFQKNYNQYDMKKILNWYTKGSFLYKLTNNCLRIGTVDSIQYCRLILKDLEIAIKECYQNKSKDFSGVLYRGAYLSNKDWSTLEQNIGKEIEMHGFLSTSKTKKVAIKFLSTNISNKALISIIVPRTPDKGTELQGFAEVKEFTDFPNEDEVLFNVRSRFTILEANIEEIEGIQCRHLVLLYGAQDLRRFLKVNNPKIEVQINDVEQIKCYICHKEGAKYLKENALFVNILHKDQYLCNNCLVEFLNNNRSPLLCIPSSSIVKSSEVESVKLELEGIVIQYQEDLKNLFYGYKCTLCQETKDKCYSKCLGCQQPMKIWCKKCFKPENDCIKAGHLVVSETFPFTFWSEKMSEKEFKHLTYQNYLSHNMVLFEQAQIFDETQNYAKVIEYYEKFLEKKLKKQKGAVIIKTEDVAMAYNNLGQAYDKLGKYEKAKDCFLASLEINRGMSGDSHPFNATLCMNLGLMLNKLEQYEDSREFHEMNLKLNKAIYGENHESTADSYRYLGGLCEALRQDEKALAYRLKCLEIKKSIYGDQHPSIITSYDELRSVYNTMGQYDKAMECHLKSLEINKTLHGDKHPSTSNSYLGMGDTYQNLKQYDKAIECYLKDLEISKSVFGDHHPITATSYTRVGSVYNHWGQYDEAKEYYLKSLEINKSVYGEQHSSTGTSYHKLGSIYEILGETEKALEYLIKGLEICRAVFGEKHPNTIASYKILQLTYQKLGQNEKALECFLGGLQANKIIELNPAFLFECFDKEVLEGSEFNSEAKLDSDSKKDDKQDKLLTESKPNERAVIKEEYA